VVTSNQGHARVDRISLQNARVSFSRAVSSAKAARDYLNKHGADVVIVDDNLDDSTGWDFMRSIKRDARLRDVPVIMASSGADSDRVLEAIRLGCVGYLVRPYTLDSFFKHLSLARQSRQYLREELSQVEIGKELAKSGQPEAAVMAITQAADTADEAVHHYETGMRHLARQEFTQAVESFTRAARLSELMAEAHMGLARCWLALGDEVRYRKALTQAALICARTRRFERYKDQFIAILQEDPREFNPFVSLGIRLAREMDWDGALMALKNAIWLVPGDAKAHLELAKVYHFKREPELAKRSVGQALTLSPHDHEALGLHERWTGKEWGEPEESEMEGRMVLSEKPMFPDMIPSMLNGVLYLAGVVTEGIHRFRRDYA
jgi:response regulator of citrate/malate metabolism